MIYKKILTGSRQIFGHENGDLDHIIIQDQDAPFEYVRDEQNKTCEFRYKNMSKNEYMNWLKSANRWDLNITALLCEEFTTFMNINILSEDKDFVFELMRKFFKRHYLLPFGNSFNKYFYKTYLYYLYMTNQSYELSEQELSDLADIKANKYRETILTKLYEFYGCESYLPQIIRVYKVKTELDEIAEWFENTDHYCNKVVTGEWSKDDPRFVQYLQDRIKVRQRQDELKQKLNK